MRRTLLIALACGCALVACSDDGGHDAQGDLYPDLGPPPDRGAQEPCAAEWIDALFAQDAVSTGDVTTTDVGDGVMQTLVDASAGGMQSAKNNPWVYISLGDGQRVDVTDLDSKDSSAWDLALRRAVIRVNGGDSGSGQGAVARLAGQQLEDVTAAPAPASFVTDDFLDESCAMRPDPIGNPATAFSGETEPELWYEYDIGSGKLTPRAEVYVIRRAGGEHVKLVIDSYYQNGDSGPSAHYTLRWSAL